MARASSVFVGFSSTSLPCQMVTGVSDVSVPKLLSRASAPGSSSSSIQTWGRRLRVANPLSRVASLEWRAPREEGLEDDVREVGLLADDLLQPLPRDSQHLPAHAHHGREVDWLPGEHVKVPHEAARAHNAHRPRLAGEVVDHFYLALEDDEEVVLGVARPEEDLPCLRHPPLPVSPEDLGLVFPQRRGPRTADLTGSIVHRAPSSVALPGASIAPPTADRRMLTLACCCLGVPIGLQAHTNSGEVRRI